ncbi:hypothetical protein A0H81_04491 [Grifola frondosa]|uniref:DNA-directed RNA polymerase III subunit RPC3 n=1 Tax=Grifola frondosa TaxID=5627 RepID=A0A1C7MFG2_GRIFR|nr:hypothetical protein A0H81_04491 [Grifola frondosa]
MADADTARLCEQIIRTNFGPLTATVASVLLTRGRLPLSQVVRFSRLKPRTVRAVVLVLVNIDECLMRLRYGRYVWQAAQLYGNASAEIIQLILDHGKLRPPELYRGSQSPAIYSQALHKLVDGSYLKPSTVLFHISPRDKRIKRRRWRKLV